jgi:2TM domain-containing protein
MKKFSEQDNYTRAKKRVEKIKGFYWHLFWYLAINIFLLAMIYKNLDVDENFFEYGHFTTAFFWGIGLAFHAYGVFGKHLLFSKDWEERKITEIMDKDKHKYWE